ncbi:MAG: hypothetical protein WDN25_26255 [Acetobacteraceae bacterium]
MRPTWRRWRTGWASDFELLRNTYKPYPCGIVIHPIIDACLDLRQRHAIDAGQVAAVDIRTSPGAMALCDRRNPQNELQAHVSLYHWTAAVLIRGTAGIAELQDPTVRDPAIIALQDKVQAAGDSGIAADAAEVTVTLRDGSRHTCRIEHGIGSGEQSDDRCATDPEVRRTGGAGDRHRARRRPGGAKLVGSIDRRHRRPGAGRRIARIPFV